jgi:hypothetical protein
MTLANGKGLGIQRKIRKTGIGPTSISARISVTVCMASKAEHPVERVVNCRHGRDKQPTLRLVALNIPPPAWKFQFVFS